MCAVVLSILHFKIPMGGIFPWGKLSSLFPGESQLLHSRATQTHRSIPNVGGISAEFCPGNVFFPASVGCLTCAITRGTCHFVSFEGLDIELITTLTLRGEVEEEGE